MLSHCHWCQSKTYCDPKCTNRVRSSHKCEFLMRQAMMRSIKLPEISPHHKFSYILDIESSSMTEKNASKWIAKIIPFLNCSHMFGPAVMVAFSVLFTAKHTLDLYEALLRGDDFNFKVLVDIVLNQKIPSMYCLAILTKFIEEGVIDPDIELIRVFGLYFDSVLDNFHNTVRLHPDVTFTMNINEDQRYSKIFKVYYFVFRYFLKYVNISIFRSLVYTTLVY